MRKIRLVDIAKETGYSIKTVSRAIHNQDDIHPETKKAIMDVVNKYHYVPNPMAATLRTNKTQTIGYVVPDIINQFYGEVGLSIETFFREKKYSMLISFSDDTYEGEINALRVLLSKRVDGIILATAGTTGAFVKEILHEYHIPLTLIDNEFSDESTNAVLHDNIHGASILTQHLIEHNHRKIACITGLQHQTSGSERLKGYLEAMESSKLVVPNEFILHQDWSAEGGARAMNQILAMPEGQRPTALFVSNSLMALGCYKSLIRAGKRVPEDIALVSFDNLSYIESLEPPITTLSSTADAIGNEAAKLLYRCIGNKDYQSVSRITVPGTVIKRRSCGCA